MRAAAAAGIGANVYHAELPDALVVGFLNGKPLTPEQVRAAVEEGDPKLLNAVTHVIRALHAIPIPDELQSECSTGWAPSDLLGWLELVKSLFHLCET